MLNWQKNSRLSLVKDACKLVPDLVKFWFCFKGLKNKENIGGEKTVLLVSMTDWVAQVKMEGIFAATFRLRGYKPVVLTYKSNKWALMYFKVLGITDFIFFDELLDKVDEDFDPTEGLKMLEGNPSFGDVMNFKYSNSNVGQNVLSTLVRAMRSSSVEFTDPKVMEALKARIPDSMRAAKAAKMVFEKIKPEAVLFLEKGYTPYGEVFDLALENNLNVIQYVHSHRSEAMALKRYSKANRRQHVFSFAPDTWERVKKLAWSSDDEQRFLDELKEGYEKGTWFNRKFLQDDKMMKSPEEIRTQLELDPAKKTAVIFSHVLWDATFFYGKNLFDDYEEWLIQTVKVACKNDKVNWIIKVHPDYAWKMKQLGESGDPRDIMALDERIGHLPEHIKVVMPDIDISTYSFFAITDYCITVRGTIGIEAPCFGIPVITAGTGRYSGLGFTNDSETREEYLEKIKNVQDIPSLSQEETSLALRHAKFLFGCRPLEFKTFEMVRSNFNRLGGRLDNNVVIRVRKSSDLAEAKDMNMFADWVLKSDNTDYLTTDFQ